MIEERTQKRATRAAKKQKLQERIDKLEQELSQVTSRNAMLEAKLRECGVEDLSFSQCFLQVAAD